MVFDGRRWSESFDCGGDDETDEEELDSGLEDDDERLGDSFPVVVSSDGDHGFRAFRSEWAGSSPELPIGVLERILSGRKNGKADKG